MNRTRKFCEGANVKQVDLCRQLKWKQSRLASHERGARIPGLDKARRIAYALSAPGVARLMVDVFPEPKTDAEHLASRLP